MPSPELIDFDRRYPELVSQLRAGAPSAPESLRERVGALSEERRHAPRFRVPRFGFTVPRPSRRAVFVLAGAGAVAAVAAGVLVGRGGGGKDTRAVPAAGTVMNLGAQVKPQPKTWSGSSGGAAGGTADKSFQTLTVPSSGTKRALAPPKSQEHALRAAAPAQLPPASNRLQHYAVALTLRVPDQQTLSARTNRAMRLARGFGGYVVSVKYASNAGAPGDASLVLRIPITKAQQAIAQFSGLGKIVSQHVAIQDLQPQANAEQAQILDLRKTVARIQDQLNDPALTLEQKVGLEEQLRVAKLRLAGALGTHKSTVREGRLTTMRLALTTRGSAGVTVHHGSGLIDRAARNGLHVLTVVGAALVWFLIVGSPFLLLGLGAWWGRRVLRRREEERLLANA
jgi:hypothetical protein